MNYPKKQSSQIATTLCRNPKISLSSPDNEKSRSPFSGKSFCKKDPSCCQKLAFDEAFRKDSNKLHLLPKSSNNLKNSEKRAIQILPKGLLEKITLYEKKNYRLARWRFGSPLTAQSVAVTLKMRLMKIGCFLKCLKSMI